MSDTDKSLEDFFSKKKAKKGKGKTKFTTSEAITKQVGGSQKEKEKSREQTSKKSSVVQQGPTVEDPDEWIDFQEPTEKDYSGLRIQSLQISEKPDAETSEANEQDVDDEEGEAVAKEKALGPWQAPTSQPSQAPQEAKEEKPKVTGVYRPPSYRTSAGRRTGSSKQAPELNNEFAFPSLQAAAAASKGKESPQLVGGKNFEPVKHGSRTMDNPADRRPRLDLENKFDALSRS